jgi:hypothetical protein
MKFVFNAAAAAVLAISLAASYGQTGQSKPPVKKHVAVKKVKTPPSPTVVEQIQALRHELQGQKSEIDALKTGMAAKDAQLKEAEMAAASAQTAASRAEAAVAAETQAGGENAAAVTTLQSAVSSLKVGQTTLAATVTDETAKIKKAIDSPSVLHYKGVTLTPYGFFNGEAVYRTHATGGEMPTAFSSIPYEHADSYALSETYLSGRQSRIGLLVEGRPRWGTLRAIVEGDFLGVGTSPTVTSSVSASPSPRSKQTPTGPSPPGRVGHSQSKTKRESPLRQPTSPCPSRSTRIT